MTGTLTDTELVARCRQGDSAAWAQLVERFSGYVYAIVGRGFRLSDHDAEDVFQDVFARLYENLDRLKDDAAVRGWIAQTARRCAIDNLRRSGREAPTSDGEVPEPEEPEDLYAKLDTALSIRAELDALPEFCSEVVDRFFIKDQSYRTIGEAMGLPPGTIASRISRCLTNLRESLEAA